MQCLGVSSPANDAVASVYLCTDASAHLDWTFVQPGDNLSLQLTGTNLCVPRPALFRLRADGRSQLS
jgi:hypothetical protein